MKAIIILAAAFAVLAPVYGRTMDRCSLAKEMHALGVPKSELPLWTCIALHESSYRTNIVGPPNKDGSKDYGILQINNRYWCKPPNGGKSSNKCQIGCNQLLTDNIKTSVTCARKVLSAQGWGAWSTYGKCKGKLPSIDSCFK